MWTYDFVSDQTADGRRLKILTVEDEYTRESLTLEVARRITSHDVIDVLRELFAVRGAPTHIRSDNGPEFIAKRVRSWLEANKVGPLYIERGAPWQNGVCESFNGKMRDECLNLELFTSLAEARVVIEDFRREYNHHRPHSSLGYQTPASFAASCRSVSAATDRAGAASADHGPVGRGGTAATSSRRATPLALASLALAPPPACSTKGIHLPALTQPGT